MFNKEQYLDIATLIANEINGSMSDADKVRLTNWVNTSKENKAIYGSIKKNNWYSANMEDIRAIDIDRAWQKVNTRIHTRPKVISVFPKIYRYVAAVLVIGLLVTAYMFRDKFIEPLKDYAPIIVNNQIEPGTNKATLTMENGEEVVLEKGTTYQIPNATSNGEEIVYEQNGKKAKEITFNTITIPRGGQFFIRLSDGTKIWLNSESQLKYPVAFTSGNTRQVELIYGEAYFDVSPSTDHKGSKFKVMHHAQEVEVLGTEFNIKAYKDETHVYTTLVEGKVAVNYNGKNQLLVPGEQSNLNAQNNNINITTVDIYNETAWKKGVFSFEDKPLGDIMKVLARWYDMEVVFENEAQKEEMFIGTFNKNSSIDAILKAIKNTNFINNYEIDNKTLIIK